MTYIPNPAFEEQLAADPRVKAVLNAYARRAGTYAVAVGRSIADTGDYARSIEVEDNRVATTDPAGHIIEWGSSRNRPFAPLRKAAEQTGATYEDAGSA